MNDKTFDYWDYFKAEAERIGCPLYAQLADGMRGSPQLQAFARTCRKGQPPANILFGAVHYLLIRGAQHPLRRYYPHLNGGAPTPKGEDPFPLFADFVAQHRDELAPLVAAKVTNTNEVGRASILHAGFRALASEAGAPLNLIEIGPSAGLNLIWDRYGVRYRRGAETFELPIPDPALTIHCELRGERTPPFGPTPEVASRIGLELNPVDLSDPGQRDWLRALVWPGTQGRFELLDSALAAAMKQRAPIRAGNALDLLPDALREVPEDQTVCIYHSYVVYQFSSEMRTALESILTLAGLRRPVWRLGIEGDISGGNTMQLACYRDGTRRHRRLALCHPHGFWLDWRNEAWVDAGGEWQPGLI